MLCKVQGFIGGTGIFWGRMVEIGGWNAKRKRIRN